MSRHGQGAGLILVTGNVAELARSGVRVTSVMRRLRVAVLAKIDLRWSWTVCSDTNMCWVMSRVAAPVTR